MNYQIDRLRMLEEIVLHPAVCITVLARNTTVGGSYTRKHLGILLKEIGEENAHPLPQSNKQT